ncbi:MAG: DNA methyltransferase [Gammaproteobacteria bacterium]|nr:DNA methyltransferase [Gammaproteobacteria bacterium]MCY4277065.1 DNA methyltransferase [Gammaproteobacteria bacterium]
MSSLQSMDKSQAYGTFKDSLRAPVHRWFTYPAGYSYKLVEAKIEEHEIGPEDIVGDPFVGTGTTSLAAKLCGVSSVGVEAHPFVYWIAQTKLHFERGADGLSEDANSVLREAEDIQTRQRCVNEWPDLVYKCFSQENLSRLGALRTAIDQCESVNKDLLKVALTATLRDSTSAGAGWPYIAPSKFAERKVDRNAFSDFTKRCALIESDIVQAMSMKPSLSSHTLELGDARRFSDYSGKGMLKIVLTSPPYLNNYDYADRTRLETYFWGMFNSWGEITKHVRDKLIVAATTQVRRSEMERTSRLPEVGKVSPSVQSELTTIVGRLSKLRREKSGNKSYDLMVAGYFEDMLQVIVQVYESLAPSGVFILVLGDSAPYGVHVATDELVARIALDVGFKDYAIEIIRTRGDKWAGNPQRHQVPLRESIVTLRK